MDPLFIPKLRQDIHINPAPPGEDGSPTWTLYDPTANKYFKIGWFEFECLVRLDKCKTTLDLVQSLTHETTLKPDLEDIRNFVLFLIGNHLVRADDPAIVSFLEEEKKLYKAPVWKQVFKGYLFFSIPLVKPQRFLEATLPLVRPLLTRQFFILALCVLGYGLYLTSQRVDEFMATFMSYMNFQGVMYVIAATIFVKIFHELGHAYVATKYGVPVPVMGVALIVMYPILYTETTGAWKLSSRKKRIRIAAAGVMAEMVVAAIALMVWHFTPPGPVQSVAFFVGFTSLLASIVVNSNPLMRFDGYFLLSDLVGIDNMQDRGFAFAKWRIRKFLLGWHDEPPEYVSAKRKRFLQIFGIALIIYRFTLYTGIAFAVYYLFMKPLGMIFMVYVFAWFIGTPLLRELNVWREHSEIILRSTRVWVYVFVICAGLVSTLVPLQRSVEIPAVVHASVQTRMFAPMPAYIDRVWVKPFQRVHKGELLFSLSSNEVDYRLEGARLHYESLKDLREREQALPEISRQRITIEEEIATAKDALDGLVEQKEQLEIRAPFDGIMRDISPDIHAGRWVGNNKLLGVVLQPEEVLVSGYVREADVVRVYDGLDGHFYPSYAPLKRFPVRVSYVDRVDAKDIYWKELSSLFGGPLPSDPGKEGKISLRNTSYAVDFKVNDRITPSLNSFVGEGVVKLSAKPVSVFSLFSSWFVSLSLREGGL